MDKIEPEYDYYDYWDEERDSFGDDNEDDYEEISDWEQYKRDEDPNDFH